MKATGVVRRIDDLGRIVIPKEIRRVCGIHEGDAFELYTDQGAIILKKYEKTPSCNILQDLIESINAESKNNEVVNYLISQLKEQLK